MKFGISILTSRYRKVGGLCTLLFAALSAITTTTFAQQKRLSLETGLYLGTDAEGVFIGPALSAGMGYALGKQIIVSTQYTFYYSRISGPETFMTHTFDALFTFQFQNVFKPGKGFYFGIGPAWQYRKQTPEEIMVERNNYWLGVFAMGYRCPLNEQKKINNLAIELKGFGPYIEEDPLGDYVEGLTQLMLGVRCRF